MLVQPLLSPVTFSEVLAGSKLLCGHGLGLCLAKFFVKWTNFGQIWWKPLLKASKECFWGFEVLRFELSFYGWPRIWASFSKIVCEMDTFRANLGEPPFEGL